MNYIYDAFASFSSEWSGSSSKTYIFTAVILVWNSVMTHSIGKSISCEDRPGPPVGVMAEGLMDMLSKTINIVRGEFS